VNALRVAGIPLLIFAVVVLAAILLRDTDRGASRTAPGPAAPEREHDARLKAKERREFIKKFRRITVQEAYDNPNIYHELVQEMMKKDLIVGMRTSELFPIFEARSGGVPVRLRDTSVGEVATIDLSSFSLLLVIVEDGKIVEASVEYEGE